MKLSRKRVITALVIGGFIGTLPQLIAMFPITSRLDGVQELSNYLLVPGVLVGLVLNGWNVHDPEFAIVLIASAIFYALCIYALLTLLARRTQADANGGNTAGLRK